MAYTAIGIITKLETKINNDKANYSISLRTELTHKEKTKDGKEVEYNIFIDENCKNGIFVETADQFKLPNQEESLNSLICMLAVNGSKATFTLEIDKDEKDFTIIGVELSNEK